jgi:hypothetical protein
MKGMSPDEIRALPASVDLATAGLAFGFGRTRSFELARSGEFPVRVIPVGRRPDGSPVKFRVPRSAILEELGIEDTRQPAPCSLTAVHDG